jgi:hypothetical protein
MMEPPSVQYVTLLAMWNVSDATGKSSNTVSLKVPWDEGMAGPGREFASRDLSFLKCGLSWGVRAATIDASSTLLATSTLNGGCYNSEHSKHSPATVSAGSCFTIELNLTMF